MIFALLFMLSVLALILPGEALLRWLVPGYQWGWYRPWVAFGIGQGAAMFCLWCLGMCGVPMWTWGIGIVLTISMLAIFWLWRRDGNLTNPCDCLGWCENLKSGFFRRRGWRDYFNMALSSLPWMIMLFAALIVGLQALDEALEFRIGSVAGMGNWAYKAKLLLMTESWPADFFEYEAHNRRMGYPPGYPLLCGWCAAFMGGLETHAIRLLPVALTVGTFLLAGGEMIRWRSWWGLPGVAALLVLFLGYPARGILAHFYAEPLLLYMVAVFVVALAKAPENSRCVVIGLLAAGCMAWTKNEGVVGFLMIAGCLLVFANTVGISGRTVFLTAGCVACVMILPWRIYLAAHGWSDESFAWEAFIGEGQWDRFFGAWHEYRETMFQHGSLMGGAWWLAPMLVWFAFQWKRYAMLAIIVLVALGWVAVAMVMMMGSVEDNFAWHVGAAPRVLLCPSLILLMGYSYLKTNKLTNKHRENDEKIQ